MLESILFQPLSVSKFLGPLYFVGIDEWLALPMNPRPFWWLLHLRIGVHTLSTHAHLACNGGGIDFFGAQILDLVRALHSLLMKGLALLTRPFVNPVCQGTGGGVSTISCVGSCVRALSSACLVRMKRCIASERFL